MFEQKEIDYRIQVCQNLERKKSKKEIKKELIETKKAYKNLYTSENINNKDSESKESNNENIPIISNTSKTNIIKINLSSLEFEQTE